MGRTVATKIAQGAAEVVNHEFRNIANGVYIVEAISADKRVVQRVVVN